MSNALFHVPVPTNEPILNYAPNSPEKLELKHKLEELSGKTVDIPLIIGGEEIRTGNTDTCIMPHKHGHVLATYHQAGEKEIDLAVEASREAWKLWSKLDYAERLSIFLKMAELLRGPWRATLNAATMLSQSKTAFQAEIDSACELIDFWRFNAHYAQQIFSDQPGNAPGIWDRSEWRPLEGFVLAVTPFNFTSIAGNLPTAPAMLGNVAIWKPASTAVYSGYYLMKLFEAAGLPKGVINFLPGPGKLIGPKLLKHPELAGVHFTGSTATFQSMWKTVGENITGYRSYPRIVGETGGKDFIIAHPSADIDELAIAIVRGAFEFQGQKCSAASRAYIPESLWGELKTKLVAHCAEIKMGNPSDFRNFMAAVIDRASFDKIKGYIDFANESPDYERLLGGTCDDSEGYFIEPTIFVTSDPKARLMEEEIFGPVMTLYVYPDEQYEETLVLLDSTSPYALTGAVFSKDRYAVQKAHEILRYSAGNFYVNDKPTGAVVGQQPFGGSRASGTNDKAGSMINLLRWLSPRTIKETFVPPKDFRYPHMDEE